MPPDVPVPIAEDASRSRVYWEARQRLGSEAARHWPRLLRSLLEHRPELGYLDDADRRREPGAGSYRGQSADEVVLRMRASDDGVRHGWKLIGLAAVVVLLGAWAVNDVVTGAELGLLAAWLLGTGTYLAAMRYRRDEVRISPSTLRIRRRGRVALELTRDAIAYVETRQTDDEAVVEAVSRAERLVMPQKHMEPRVVCLRTIDGELLPIGGPLDRVAAEALCAAIEDELGLLPTPRDEEEGPRVRVATDPMAEEDALVLEAPEPRRSVDAEDAPAG